MPPPRPLPSPAEGRPASLPHPASRGRCPRRPHRRPSGGAERRHEKHVLIGGDAPGGDESGALIGRQHPKVGVKTRAEDPYSAPLLSDWGAPPHPLTWALRPFPWGVLCPIVAGRGVLANQCATPQLVARQIMVMRLGRPPHPPAPPLCSYHCEVRDRWGGSGPPRGWRRRPGRGARTGPPQVTRWDGPGGQRGPGTPRGPAGGFRLVVLVAPKMAPGAGGAGPG